MEDQNDVNLKLFFLKMHLVEFVHLRAITQAEQ